MIKSMTGYGKAEIQSEYGSITVEARSVNHRYGEVFVKLPRLFYPYENDVKKLVSERLKRGKIELFVQLEQAGATNPAATLNIPLAKSYYETLSALRDALGTDETVTLSMVLNHKEIFSAGASDPLPEVFADDLFTAVKGAVDNLELMRLREGEALHADFVQRRTTLAELIAQVAKLTPQVVVEYQEKLRERIANLLGENTLDEGRLAQEVAIMADRSDITEELVRFNSHLKQFDDMLAMADPVGRKLDFLMQELNREVNTIGSKANDAKIAASVVELKAELERIREQVQNIE